MKKGFTPAPSAPGLTRRSALQATTAALAGGAAPWSLAQRAAQGATPDATPATLQIVGPWEFTSLAPASSGYMLLNLQV